MLIPLDYVLFLSCLGIQGDKDVNVNDLSVIYKRK